MYTDTCAHLRGALDNVERRLLGQQAADTLKREGLEYDALAVTGLSGIIFGTTLADITGKELIVIRKEEKPAPHSWRAIEHPDEDGQRWIFVDDLISSGTTWKRVRSVMDNFGRDNQCVGVLLYFEWSASHLSAAGITVPVFSPHERVPVAPLPVSPVGAPAPANQEMMRFYSGMVTYTDTAASFK